MMKKLTKQQQVVFKNIIKDINESLEDPIFSNNFISLSGPAGTGKTFLISFLVRYLKKQNSKIKIFLTSPTHKSLKVIRKMVNQNNLNISYATIHSFLNLKLKPNLLEGIQELILEKNKKNKKADLLIIDESSMISEKLFNFIKKAKRIGRTKVILFVGDPYQLPPVDTKKEDLPVFSLKQYKLTEIVRQAKDNPIINLSFQIRERIKSKNFIPIKDLFQNQNQNKNIQIFTNFEKFMNAYFNDPSDKIIGAYTNKQVENYNFRIRKKLKGDVPYLIPGDKLTLQEPLVEGEEIIHANGETIEVKDCEKIFDKNVNIYYWKIKDTENKKFKIIDPFSQNKFKEILEMLAIIAKSKKGYEKRKAWEKYFDIKNAFIDVKYNFAVTLHKLQGSTYNNVYLDLRGLDYLQDKEFLYRLCYVGITRASNAIKIIL